MKLANALLSDITIIKQPATMNTYIHTHAVTT